MIINNNVSTILKIKYNLHSVKWYSKNSLSRILKTIEKGLS